MTLLPLVLIAVAILGQCSEVLEGQQLALTIYNGGFGLVRDRRTIAFDAGTSFVSFTDVAATIQTETVMFKPLQADLSPSNRIRIYQQNYENHLASRYALLKKYLEKNVSVEVVMGDRAHNRKGKLLAYQQAILMQTLKGVDIYPHVNVVTVDSYLAEGLMLKPTLIWKVHSPIKQSVACEVSYRADGFSWKADYNMVLSDDEHEANFTGWVTIDNRSGKRYVNTSLKLIAGDVHVVKPKRLRGGIRRKFALRAMAEEAPKPGFSEKSFADYHMYTLGRRVDVNESSQKQIEFIPTAVDVEVDRYYAFTINVGRTVRQKIDVSSRIKFINEKSNNLGMPLPKGTVRVFKRDQKDGSLEFIGEDNINHTPKNENITVQTGNAFDIVARTKLKSMTKTRNGYDAVKRLEVHNRGDIDRQFRIELNNYYGDRLQLLQPLKHSLYWHRQSATKFTLNFRVESDQARAIQWLESVRN